MNEIDSWDSEASGTLESCIESGSTYLFYFLLFVLKLHQPTYIYAVFFSRNMRYKIFSLAFNIERQIHFYLVKSRELWMFYKRCLTYSGFVYKEYG